MNLLKFKKLFNSLKSKFYYDYNASSLTWFRAGGKAEIFCIVYDENELEIILNCLKDFDVFIIGAGSNVLIRDNGFKGAILKLGKNFNNLKAKDNLIEVGASILDVNLSKFALINLHSKLEFFSGIPGSIGGAIKMNAGCFGSETKDVLESVKIFSKNGSSKILHNKDLNFSYRSSSLNDDDIVVSATFNTKRESKDKIEDTMQNIKFKREHSQPLKTKTGGSTFKNPKNLFAAKLIEESECKGLSVGDAIISTKHANFIINTKNASAKDIEELGKRVLEKVLNKFDIKLEWEIKIIGEKN